MEDHRLAGFTLFELLITLAVIGILAGLAVPAFHTLIMNARLRSAAETIADDLRMARRTAVLQNAPQLIQFQYLSRTQWSYSYPTDLSQKSVGSGEFPNIVLKKPAFSGNGLIQFAPIRGTVNAGRLDFSTPSGRKLSVILSPLGRVRLCSDNDARYAAC